MEPSPFLRPTALQQMRGFLAESGATLPPWSGSGEVMDELVSLLYARRDDGAFFARLTPFLEDLRATAAQGESGLPARDAEVLSRATVESMVADLRERLRSAPRGASAPLLRSLVGERGATLLCLALLASGVSACTQESAPRPASEPGTANPVGALPVVPLKKLAPPPPENRAPPGSTDKLVEVFRQKSPEEAAKVLEQVLDASTPAPTAVPEQPRPAVDIDIASRGHAKYKGVSL
jgi:hypothetical protein